MCRNIKRLANLAPPATDEEIRGSALQFVRKLSGMKRPSRVNQLAFDQAVEGVAAAVEVLLHELKTVGPPRDRNEEARRARGRESRRTA